MAAAGAKAQRPELSWRPFFHARPREARFPSFGTRAQVSALVTSIESRHRMAAIAQLGERQAEDLNVPGLIPGLGMPCLGPEEAKRLDFQTSTLQPCSADAIFQLLPWQKNFITSCDSSAGRASARRSEGPRFDPGSRQKKTAQAGARMWKLWRCHVCRHISPDA